MTDNVFDSAAESLNHAKDEIATQLQVEDARHLALIDQENRYHTRRVFELERLMSEFGDHIPQEPVVPTLPHSRACGIVIHEHGSACHANCPTCRGLPKTLGSW